MGWLWLQDRMERGQRASDVQARQRLVATQRKVDELASLSDGELIAAAQARMSLAYPCREMEMQRRLKDSVDGSGRRDALRSLVGVLVDRGHRCTDGGTHRARCKAVAARSRG
jgi:hypothetical protein